MQHSKLYVYGGKLLKFKMELWDTFLYIYETATIIMTSANFLRYVNEIHFLKFTVLFICKCTRADFMGFFIFSTQLNDLSM